LPGQALRQLRDLRIASVDVRLAVVARDGAAVDRAMGDRIELGIALRERRLALTHAGRRLASGGAGLGAELLAIGPTALSTGSAAAATAAHEAVREGGALGVAVERTYLPVRTGDSLLGHAAYDGAPLGVALRQLLLAFADAVIGSAVDVGGH